MSFCFSTWCDGHVMLTQLFYVKQKADWMLNFVLMRSAFCRGVPLPTAIGLPCANSPTFQNLNFVAHEISKFSDNGRIREFKIQWLLTTTTDKHATAHDQNHVTVHFSRVVLQLRWVVELFRVVATTQNILLVCCRSVIQESHLFVKKFSIHLL